MVLGRLCPHRDMGMKQADGKCRAWSCWCWGSFPGEKGGWWGQGGRRFSFSDPGPSPLGFVPCGFLFFYIASQFSSTIPLCKKDFAEMNGAGHFHLSTPCSGSVTRVYLSN